MTSASASGSKLVPLGVLLILLAFGVPMILERLTTTPMTLPFALASDGFRFGFFVGLALLVIGLLRNRKRRKTDNAPS